MHPQRFQVHPGFRWISPLRWLCLIVAVSQPGCFSGPSRTIERRHIPHDSAPLPDLSSAKPWSGWDDLAAPAVRFKFMRDWTARNSENQPVSWNLAPRSNPKEDTAAEWMFSESEVSRTVFFRPPTPVPLRKPFDTADLWMLWEPTDPASPRALRRFRITAWLEFKTGEAMRMPFSLPDASGWQLAQRTLPREFVLPSRFPARLTGFSIEAEPGPAGRLLFSGWTPYTRSDIPIHASAPVFRRGSASEPDPDADPTEGVPRAMLTLDGAGSETVRFEPEPDRLALRIGSGGALGEASLDPNHPLDGVRLRFDTGETLVWGGIHCSGPDRGYPGKRIFQKRSGNGIRLGYEAGLIVTVEPDGAGLALTFEDDSRRMTAVSWSGLPAQLPIRNRGNSCLSIRRLNADPVRSRSRYAALAWDPFATGASTGPEPDPDRAVSANRVLYLPDDSGRRPVFRERFLISAANGLDALIPRIPSFEPPLLQPGQILWIGESSETMAGWKRFGLTDLVRVYPLKSGTVAPPGGTLLDQHPLQPGWSRDAVVRNADGSWRSGSAPGTTRMKLFDRFRTLRFLVEDRAPDASAVWLPLPEQTSRDWTDFDSRVPDCGSYNAAIRQAVAAWKTTPDNVGRGLVLEADISRIFAPWATAMLRSDRQAQAFCSGDGRDENFPPDFPQTRPAIGAGSFTAWKQTHPTESEDTQLARFLAVQLAAGGGGRLPEDDSVTPAHMVWAALALQTMHAHTGGERPVWQGVDRQGTIAAADSSDDTGLCRGKLYQRFSGEMEAWINLSPDLEWTLQAGNETWTLPPSGWVVTGPGYRNLAVRQDGAAVHFMEDGEKVYFRCSDPDRVFHGYQSAQGVLVRRKTSTLFDSDVEVYDYAQSGQVRIHGDEWTGWLARTWECYSMKGDILGSASALTDGESILLQGPKGTLMYRLPRESIPTGRKEELK